MHVGVQRPVAPTPADLRANLRRLGDLGLEVTITEMDVRLDGATGGAAEVLKRQGQVYDE
jgi:endo-1,4-beta-xylanase